MNDSFFQYTNPYTILYKSLVKYMFIKESNVFDNIFLQ